MTASHTRGENVASSSSRLLPRDEEEILIADGRSDLRPSQVVEQKLIGLLKASPLMVSQVQRRMRPGPR